MKTVINKKLIILDWSMAIFLFLIIILILFSGIYISTIDIKIIAELSLEEFTRLGFFFIAMSSCIFLVVIGYSELRKKLIENDTSDSAISELIEIDEAVSNDIAEPKQKFNKVKLGYVIGLNVVIYALIMILAMWFFNSDIMTIIVANIIAILISNKSAELITGINVQKKLFESKYNEDVPK